jgi:hypothetical protein
VLALRVVDQRHRRARHARHAGDLARVVHAELEHRGAVPGRQPEHGQRHADLVVQVAARSQAGVVAVRGRQDRGQHLLDRGLAVAAGHRDHRQREAGAPGGGQVGERRQRVVDHQHRHRHRRRGRPGQRPAVHQQRAGTRAQRLGDEFVAVEALAAQRDEEFAGPHARVSVDTPATTAAPSPTRRAPRIAAAASPC